jgi:hypothetical protein
MKLALSIAFLAVISAAPAFAQRMLEPPTTSGNVTLSLDEYNRLLGLANRPGKALEAPPLPYVLNRAELKLRVTNDGVMGSVQVEGETLGSNVTKVPLTNGMTILDARQGSRPLPLLLDNGTHVAVLPGSSDFSVNLEAGLPLSIETGRASFALPAPAAGSVRLSLTVPGDRTNVQLNRGIITHRATVDGNTQIEATLVPGQVATIWWATREVVAPPVPREVRFLSDVKTLVSVSETDLQIAALAGLTVLQGDADQFAVPVPQGFEVTSVNGPSLESSEVRDGVLYMKIAGHGRNVHEFLITMEHPLSDSQAVAPILAFKDAQRETGEVLVEGQGTLEMTAKESGGLKRLDVKEINPYLRSLSRYPLQAAFRYHRQSSESPKLALEWTRFPDASVLSAVAEHAEVTTLVTAEGRSLTEVKLTVKNQAQPFLKVELPAGASILTADVGGEKVKPVQGADGNRVPLLRSGFRPAGSYTVSFVFQHAGAPLSKKGDSDLALPKMDIPIAFLEWEVFLPDRYKVRDFGGDTMPASVWPASYSQLGDVVALNPGASSGAGIAGRPSAAITELPMIGRNFNGSLTLTPEGLLASGELAGVVIDPSGAVIASAHLDIENLATHATWSVATTAEGKWLVAGLPTGSYQVSATAPGFQMTRTGLSYNANNPSSCQILLALGSTVETVEVSAAATAVNTDSAEISSHKQKKPKNAVAPPPQASANVFNLQQRVAGVLPVPVIIPRDGTSYRFVRPLVMDEETKLSFAYKAR